MKQSLLIFLHFFDKPITNHKFVIKFLLSVSYFFNSCKRKALDCTLRGTMVSLRETIKGFALACMREAHDCNPSGYHDHPSGDNQGLCPCMQGLRP